MDGILITTGDLKEDYEVIDAIFAVDSAKESFFAGADPNKAFDRVKNALRSKCAELGGHAVINCEFEYRVAAAQGLLGGSKTVVEIFAYGTAVRTH